MTRGKKADSDMPRNQRRAKRPLKFFAATMSVVMRPKESIIPDGSVTVSFHG